MRSYDHHDLVEIPLVVHHEQSRLIFFLNVLHEHTRKMFLKQADSYSEPSRSACSIPASVIVSPESSRIWVNIVCSTTEQVMAHR